MIFTQTPLVGAFQIDIEPMQDERGFFARSWCHREAAAHGIDLSWVQCNISHNVKRGTLRGMHYQAPDFEDKLVRVTRGAIFDAIVDLRPESPSYRGVFHVELTGRNHRMLLVPRGFAHGFQSLEDDTEIFYQMSEFYAPGQSHGFRFDDPQFDIPWPLEDKILSDRDRDLPVYAP